MSERLRDSMTVYLPGGYVDTHGVLHRQVELRPLSGRDEELLVGYRRGETASLVTAVLQRCVRRLGTLGAISTEVIRHLLVADRQYVLLKLRELTLGETIRAILYCPWPGCGKKGMVSFSTHDIPVSESLDKGPLYTMQLSAEAAAGMLPSPDITFRLPNGADQEALAPLLAVNEAQALSLLLQRCLYSVGPLQPPDAATIAGLSALARMEIEQQMERLAPQVEWTMESQCPECGRAYAIPFDIQDFFFGELHLSRDLLYREVHYLAYHYHWGERDIMAMPRQKRRAYIAMLAEELGKLHDATA